MKVRIWGSSRSGSTVIENVLSDELGIYALGEIKNIYHRGYKMNEYCSCGEKFHDCLFWSKINLLPHIKSSEINMAGVYHTLGDIDYIDSSKLPWYYYGTKMQSDKNLLVVRNISDVISSYTNTKVRKEAAGQNVSYMRKMMPPVSFVYWWVVNMLSIVLLPKKCSILLFYDDFIRLFGGRAYSMHLSHQVSGNPSRLDDPRVYDILNKITVLSRFSNYVVFKLASLKGIKVVKSEKELRHFLQRG